MRHMVAHDARNHADDVFDSTPFKSTPFKNLTSEAAKLGVWGYIYTLQRRHTHVYMYVYIQIIYIFSYYRSAE